LPGERRLAAQPPQAVQETKRILNQHLRANAERALRQGLAAETFKREGCAVERSRIGVARSAGATS